ncbi:hypothetical protein A0H81_08202 [Grifola frondosa]|uniref:Uncharacterized protein n=1 Tax=Grifola frondosa TaxID=5627 RepID=A0A1C7M4L2_GRIFR|nr:hypothetical protein A0H81_08202 [Grifola frondosa]
MNMDQSAVAFNPVREDSGTAERVRMDAFRLGTSAPSATINHARKSSHARSHSRNTSISTSVSIPLSVSPTPSTTTNDSPPSSPTRSSLGASKRNSHHRRRSSSASDDNINLGDKDSIRRRALWALEGKTSVGTYSVEIPELGTPELAKRSFEFKLLSTRRLLPARHRPASLNLRPLSLASGTVINPTNGDLPTPTLTPSPRPGLKSLTLPGLPSLSSGLSSNAATGPAASKRQSLILSSSPISTPGSFARKPPLSMSMDNSPPVPPQPTRRSSISYVSSGGTPPMPSYGLPTPEMTPTTDRRSSSGSVDMEIHHGRPLSASEQHFLFQAHQTLVQRITDLERALSHSRASSSRSRPVSCASSTSSMSSACEPSDEMLQLVADIKAERDELKKDVDGWRVRVGDLERQVSIFAKRVEVERRDAWVARERVGLLEVEKAKLQKTLEERDLQAREAQARFDSARQDAERATRECETLREEAVRMRDAEAECARLRAALQKEQARREEVERELEGAGLLATPRPFEPVVYPTPLSRTMMFARSRGLGFRSTDSESSFTDVDSLDGSREGMSAFGLKAVEEVEEDDSREDTLSNGSDDEDELARYEDEDECDVYMFHTSSSASSLGSAVDGFEHTTPRLSPEPAPALTASRSNSSSPTPLPSPIERSPAHARHASLSKVWTFPAATDSSPAFDREPEEIDRFLDVLRTWITRRRWIRDCALLRVGRTCLRRR